MKKYLLVFMMMLLTLTVSAHDIEVKNADDVTIYYNYINEGTELEVTFRGDEECYECYYEYSGNVVIPEEVNYMGRILKVTSIGEYTFWHCDITSVTIPNSVTNIGDFAFDMCNRMTSVTIPNSVTSIGRYAFEYCSRLTSVTIGNSVTSIGDHAFDNCNRMTSVSIGNSVTSIGDLAFYNCKRLTSEHWRKCVLEMQWSDLRDHRQQRNEHWRVGVQGLQWSDLRDHPQQCDEHWRQCVLLREPYYGGIVDRKSVNYYLVFVTSCGRS